MPHDHDGQSAAIEFLDPDTGQTLLRLEVARGVTKPQAIEMLRRATVHIDDKLTGGLLEESEWESRASRAREGDASAEVIATFKEPINSHADTVDEAQKMVRETVLHTTRRLRVMGFSSVVAATYDDPMLEDNHIVGSYRGNVFTCLGLATHLRDDIRKFLDMGGRALKP
jgi:hypothetical protein